MSNNRRAQVMQDLMTQIRYASAYFVMFSEMVASKVGLHSTDNECLDFLMLNGPATAGQISEFTGLTTGAVTAMIDRLEKASYVRRERDTEDRRKVYVIPNEAKINAEIVPYMMKMGAATDAMSAEFSVDELEVILRFMTRANEVAREVIGEMRGG